MNKIDKKIIPVIAAVFLVLVIALIAILTLKHSKEPEVTTTSAPTTTAAPVTTVPVTTLPATDGLLGEYVVNLKAGVSLNVRAEPSTASIILISKSGGDKVNIDRISDDGKWGHIVISGTDDGGWLHLDYLSRPWETSATTTAAATSTAPAA
ncbi:MAG: SH3 domain-containing protein [Clostridiales bacterium]|nr:SH3 domain-containing protein [Clostridiales bacterium]